MPVSFPVEANGRTYAAPRSCAVAICLDGCEPAYLDAAIARGLMPNQCRTLRFPKPEVPEGVYQLVVVSETDAGERFGVTQEMRWEN